MTRAEKEKLIDILSIESCRYCNNADNGPEERRKYFFGMVDGIEHCIDIIADMEETNE